MKRSPRELRKLKKIASPQFRNGKFWNVLPEQTRPLHAMKEWFSAESAHREPAEPISVISRSRTDFSNQPSQSLHVTWLGHSTLIIEIDGLRFLTDPVWGLRASPLSFAGPKRFFEPPLPLSELPAIDAIILSHDHYDHFCSETLSYFKKHAIPFLVPLGVGDRLEQLGIGNDRIFELDWWETMPFKGVTLACTPTRHFSGRTPFDRNTTLWCSWCIIGQENRFYFSGDTGMCHTFKKIGEKFGPFDIVAMESGAYHAAWADIHIGPEQALQAFLDLKGIWFLPIHWATFNLSIHNWTEPGERLIERSKKLGISIVFPRPGQGFHLSDITQALQQKWWPTVPWNTAEQAPVISSGLT